LQLVIMGGGGSEREGDMISKKTKKERDDEIKPEEERENYSLGIRGKTSSKKLLRGCKTGYP